MKFTSNKQISSNVNLDEFIYFCPSCHNIRIKSGINIDYKCNRCNSNMVSVISKKDYENRNEQQRKQIINDFKATYSEVATPTEILLKKLIQNTNNINKTLISINEMLTFFFILTIIGIILMFLSYIS